MGKGSPRESTAEELLETHRRGSSESYEKMKWKWVKHTLKPRFSGEKGTERSHPGLTVLAHAFCTLSRVSVLSAMRLCCFPRQFTPVTVTVSPIGELKTVTRPLMGPPKTS